MVFPFWCGSLPLVSNDTCSELYGRAAKLKLAEDFRTYWVSSLSTGGTYRTAPELTSRGTNFRFARAWADWVWQLATGGSEGNRTPVQKSIHMSISERSRLFTFPRKVVKRPTALLGSPYCVTAGRTTRRSRSPLNRRLALAVVL